MARPFHFLLLFGATYGHRMEGNTPHYHTKRLAPKKDMEGNWMGAVGSMETVDAVKSVGIDARYLSNQMGYPLENRHQIERLGLNNKWSQVEEVNVIHYPRNNMEKYGSENHVSTLALRRYVPPGRQSQLIYVDPIATNRGAGDHDHPHTERNDPDRKGKMHEAYRTGTMQYVQPLEREHGHWTIDRPRGSLETGGEGIGARQVNFVHAHKRYDENNKHIHVVPWDDRTFNTFPQKCEDIYDKFRWGYPLRDVENFVQGIAKIDTRARSGRVPYKYSISRFKAHEEIMDEVMVQELNQCRLQITCHDCYFSDVSTTDDLALPSEWKRTYRWDMKHRVWIDIETEKMLSENPCIKYPHALRYEEDCTHHDEEMYTDMLEQELERQRQLENLRQKTAKQAATDVAMAKAKAELDKMLGKLGEDIDTMRAEREEDLLSTEEYAEENAEETGVPLGDAAALELLTPEEERELLSERIRAAASAIVADKTVREVAESVVDDKDVAAAAKNVTNNEHVLAAAEFIAHNGLTAETLASEELQSLIQAAAEDIRDNPEVQHLASKILQGVERALEDENTMLDLQEAVSSALADPDVQAVVQEVMADPDVQVASEEIREAIAKAILDGELQATVEQIMEHEDVSYAVGEVLDTQDITEEEAGATIIEIVAGVADRQAPELAEPLRPEDAAAKQEAQQPAEQAQSTEESPAFLALSLLALMSPAIVM